MGLLHCSTYHSDNDVSARGRKYHCGCGQQGRTLNPRTICLCSLNPESVSFVGNARNRRLCYCSEQKVSLFLQAWGCRPEILGGRTSARLEREVPVPVPSTSLNPSGPAEISTRTATMHSRNTLVAPLHLVSYPPAPVQTPTSIPQRGPDTSRQPHQHSSSLEANRLTTELTFSTEVQTVLLNSRKPSTRRSYKAKWERYQAFLTLHSILLVFSLCL